MFQPRTILVHKPVTNSSSSEGFHTLHHPCSTYLYVCAHGGCRRAAHDPRFICLSPAWRRGRILISLVIVQALRPSLSRMLIAVVVSLACMCRLRTQRPGSSRSCDSRHPCPCRYHCF